MVAAVCVAEEDRQGRQAAQAAQEERGRRTVEEEEEKEKGVGWLIRLPRMRDEYRMSNFF